jgi:hypothetical protein
MMIMVSWEVKGKNIKFPTSWGKDKIMSWVNADYIRICPNCNKLDVSFDHFNYCNPQEQEVIQINRDMNY